MEPLAPASSHSVLTFVSYACPSQCKALMNCHACIHLHGKPESEPTCETRLPRSPGLACGAAGPCKQSPSLTLCHMPLLFSVESPDSLAMLACILNKKTESEPTCETRLPRSPGLACGAAGPCKQSQCLTLCHMPCPCLCKALMICHACIHLQWKARV